MSDEGIVGNLTYLSGYLDETKARVRELEEELEEMKKLPVKDEPSASSIHTQRLESENAVLRQELAAVKASRKVAKERTAVKLESHPEVDLSTAKTPNTVLADSRRMCRELEKKCVDLENKVQETTSLAAKALRERVEGEKILDGVRRALRELQKINDKANEVRVVETASVIESKDTTIAKLRSKYDTLKTKHLTLRTSSYEHKTNYETVTKEKTQLQQTCRELIEVVEGLQKEAAAKCDGGKNAKFDEERTAVYAKYREYTKAFPIPDHRPPSQFDPICHKNTNLHSFLSKDPNAKSFLKDLLYLPKRMIEMSKFQFMALGPTHRYDCVTETWSEGSDLMSVHGGTRELFIDRKDFVYYIGTYKCHDLRPLHPPGTQVSSQISSSEICDAALGVPRPAGYQKIVEQCYPDGVIKAEATGLQCVGFNVQLYDYLRKRFATVLGKRKAQDESIGLVKKQKIGSGSS